MADPIEGNEGLGRIIFELRKMAYDMQELSNALAKHKNGTRLRTFRMGKEVNTFDDERKTA